MEDCEYFCVARTMREDCNIVVHSIHLLVDMSIPESIAQFIPIRNYVPKYNFIIYQKVRKWSKAQVPY